MITNTCYLLNIERKAYIILKLLPVTINIACELKASVQDISVPILLYSWPLSLINGRVM